MNSKGKKLVSVLATLMILFLLGSSVIADDHDDDDHEQEHEYLKKDHHDNDEDDSQSTKQRQNNFVQQTEYWNIWSREPRNDPTNSLPINSPEDLTVVVDGNETSIYCVPQDGQLLVSGEAIAKILGVKVKVYPQSKIAAFSKGNRELIVKSGSNAVFENKVKTPMPILAASFENSVYLPISVAANAFGYRVTWDTAKQALVLQLI